MRAERAWYERRGGDALLRATAAARARGTTASGCSTNRGAATDSVCEFQPLAAEDSTHCASSTMAQHAVSLAWSSAAEQTGTKTSRLSATKASADALLSKKRFTLQSMRNAARVVLTWIKWRAEGAGR